MQIRDKSGTLLHDSEQLHDLSDLDLHNAVLEGLTFEGAHFEYTNLECGNLRSGDLYWASFLSAN